MRLFDGGRAPNPRRVRVFLAEKGIEVPLVPVDMGSLEHRGAPITSRNPLQRLPVLELDDGTILTESVAICRYFEELASRSRRCSGAARSARRWWRCGSGGWSSTCLRAVAAAFRHLHPAMKEWEVPQVPAWGEANKAEGRRVPGDPRRRACEP